MSFSLTNTPIRVSSYINKSFTEKLDILIVMYENNIVIYTKNSSKSYIRAVQWFLNQL